MHSGLLWRPSLDRVQVEQTLTEIDKRRPVVEFYRAGSDSHGYGQLRNGAKRRSSPQHATRSQGDQKINNNEPYLSPPHDPAESST